MIHADRHEKGPGFLRGCRGFRVQVGLSIVLTALLACCGEVADPLAEVRALQARGEFARSLELLTPLVEEQRDDPETNYLFGLALAQTGRGGVAVWPLRQAAKAEAFATDAELALASVLLQGMNAEQAIAAIDRVIEREPEHVSALAMRAQARLQAHREELALEDVERALALDPERVDMDLMRVAALIGLRRLDEAREALDATRARIAEREDTPPALHARLCVAEAVFAEERGDGEAAEALHEDCTERFPTDGLVVAEAIEFLDSAGRSERSAEILERAHEQQPENVPFRTGLATRLRYGGKVDEAERLLLDATARWPSVRAWTVLGDHYVEVEDFAAAR